MYSFWVISSFKLIECPRIVLEETPPPLLEDAWWLQSSLISYSHVSVKKPEVLEIEEGERVSCPRLGDQKGQWTNSLPILPNAQRQTQCIKRVHVSKFFLLAELLSSAREDMVRVRARTLETSHVAWCCGLQRWSVSICLRCWADCNITWLHHGYCSISSFMLHFCILHHLIDWKSTKWMEKKI